MKLPFNCVIVVCMFFGAATYARSASAIPDADWFIQFGTSGGDFGSAVDIDAAGNVYISGATQGNLQAPSAGVLDVYIRKYDSSGTHLWTKQTGTAAPFEGSSGVVVDMHGAVYLSGSIGRTSEGTDYDAFVEKYSSNGTLLWRHQFGTNQDERSVSVALGDPAHTSIYVSGTTGGNLARVVGGRADRFLTKFDFDGSPLWTRQFGSAALDYGHVVAADQFGNAVVAGSTDGSLTGQNKGRRDLFVQKYSPDGATLWTFEEGSSYDDVVTDMSLDNLGNIYVGGYMQVPVGPGALNYDAFLKKLDPNGNLLWSRQLVSTGHDYISGVTFAQDNLIYVTGQTTGALGGPNAGGFDAFYGIYTPHGDNLFVEQFGTARDDSLNDVAVNNALQFAFVGDTLGSLVGSNAGALDAFVLKRTIVPEPTVMNWLLTFGLSFLFMRTARR